MADATRQWTSAAGTGEADRSDLAAAQERQAVIIGDPAPLGLAAFGVSTFVAGAVLAGWWPAPGQRALAIAPLLVVFGGITQFAAAMWSYGRGQTVPATFGGAFGALLATAGIYELALARAGGGANATDVLGPLAVGIACFAFIALVLAAASALANVGLSATSGILGLGLLLLAWAFFARGNTVLEAISGWFDIVSAALALLTAAAMIAGGRFSRLALGLRPAPRS
jgi:uncharacterized protein